MARQISKWVMSCLLTFHAWWCSSSHQLLDHDYGGVWCRRSARGGVRGGVWCAGGVRWGVMRREPEQRATGRRRTRGETNDSMQLQAPAYAYAYA